MAVCARERGWSVNRRRVIAYVEGVRLHVRGRVFRVCTEKLISISAAGQEKWLSLSV